MKRFSKGLLRAVVPSGLLLVLLLAGTPARAVTLTIGTAAGQVGDTVNLPVTVSGLTGDIRSYEIEVTWSFQRAQCVGVNTAGTLSDSWSVSPLLGTGTVTVAAASAMSLAGDGVLCELLMELGPQAGNTQVVFGPVVLNEGDVVPTLVNGSISVSALPTINISPDTGLIAVGDSLQFATSGGTAPYNYTSSDPVVADFSDSWLHGLAPGFIQATSQESGGVTNTTTGQIEVRAFRLTVGSMAVTAGQTALIPVTLDDPTGYGIVSGEVELTWQDSYATFAGIETAGTIAEAAGWAAPIALASAGKVDVVLAGTTPLSGAGVLFYLKLDATNSFPVSLGTQVFNETYPAVPVNGYLTVTALPAIGISPATAALRVGQQLQFTATGSPTAPVIWSTDDLAVATISPTGLLTAIGEGTVRVHVVDNVGAAAESGLVTVCSLAMPPLVSSIAANESVLVPVTVNRTLDPLNIYSYELTVNYTSTAVSFVGAVLTGTLTSGWGAPTVVDNGSSVSIYHAGAMPLIGCGPALIYLEFQGLPTLVGAYTGVSLSAALFNEGVPCVRINTGAKCEAVSDVPRRSESGLSLWPNRPNPFNPSTAIRFAVARDGDVELAVYSARGERVRTLATGWHTAGKTYAEVWDGRDDAGRVQSSGVYYTLLRSNGERALRKMVLLK